MKSTLIYATPGKKIVWRHDLPGKPTFVSLTPFLGEAIVHRIGKQSITFTVSEDPITAFGQRLSHLLRDLPPRSKRRGAAVVRRLVRDLQRAFRGGIPVRITAEEAHSLIRASRR